MKTFMLAGDVIKEPFLAIFKDQPNDLYPTSPRIFEKGFDRSLSRLRRKVIGSMFFTKQGEVFEVLDVEIPESKKKSYFLNFFYTEYDIKVFVRKLDWSFEYLKAVLLNQIVLELHYQGTDSKLDTQEDIQDVIVKVLRADSMAEIFNIIHTSPDAECLGGF